MTSASGAVAHDISADAHHVRLSGALTMDSVGDICSRLKPLNGGGLLVLDASGVTTADSSALALMTSLLRQARERNMRVDLRPLPQAFAAIIELYGLQDILSPHGEA
jgi:phospholipid transport system transporter-binding protein